MVQTVQEEHCCEQAFIELEKYLQIGNGVGRFILAVGESPAGNGWKKSGRAFFTPGGKVVPTGRNFLSNLKQIDERLDLENISFTEISKCFVANNRKVLPICAEKTWSHFISQIEYIKPELIILLGKKTTEIFNQQTNMTLEVGRLSEVELNGMVYNLLPIYHPSPLNPKRIRNTEFIECNLQEIRRNLCL